MNSYEFTLAFSLPDTAVKVEDYLDVLFEAGCDDAVIGTGQSGSLALDFIREADSATHAVESAMQNVQEAIPNAELIEVKPDLVGLSDVANILNCSRQNVRKYMDTYPDFPNPVYSGKTALWHLLDLANFHKFEMPVPIAELAKVTYKINLEIQRKRYQQLAI